MAIPIGLQLYSVRKECAEDLPGTVAKVAKMGYKGVEFAGYHNRSAKDLRKMIDDLGLKCCGTHIGLNTLQGDELPKTIEFNKVLGNTYLIVPWLDEKLRSNRAGWLKLAAEFNEIADKVKPHGMQVGYHNHHVEFTAMDGEVQWDTFFGNTKKEVVMQFDTGNAMQGGGDAVPFLQRYPGRATTVHIKPFSKSNPKACVGEDDLPWKTIFDLCEKSAGTKWYIVEYEVEGVPALTAVEQCLKAMKAMGR